MMISMIVLLKLLVATYTRLSDNHIVGEIIGASFNDEFYKYQIYNVTTV